MTNEQLTMQRKYRVFNRLMLLLWRLGLGPALNGWLKPVGQVMVLNHLDRNTGKRRQTPLHYAEVSGEIYCAAGFDQTDDWYGDIVANPQVEVWLPNGWWAGIAEEVIDPEVRLPILRAVLTASGPAAPALGLPVRQMSDEQLAAASANFRLIRIRRTTARTGPGGPGDLAGIWPLATVFLFWLLLTGRRRK